MEFSKARVIDAEGYTTAHKDRPQLMSSHQHTNQPETKPHDSSDYDEDVPQWKSQVKKADKKNPPKAKFSVDGFVLKNVPGGANGDSLTRTFLVCGRSSTPPFKYRLKTEDENFYVENGDEWFAEGDLEHAEGW